jgi:hypothetical protein
MVYKVTNGLRIRLARVKARVPSWLLARELEMQPSRLSTIENDRWPVSPEELENILAAIGRLSQQAGGAA